MCSCAIKENLHEGLKNSKLLNGKGWINLCLSMLLREWVANQTVISLTAKRWKHFTFYFYPEPQVCAASVLYVYSPKTQ